MIVLIVFILYGYVNYCMLIVIFGCVSLKKGYIFYFYSLIIFLCFFFNLCIKFKKKNLFLFNLYFYIEFFKLCLWKWLKKIID